MQPLGLSPYVFHRLSSDELERITADRDKALIRDKALLCLASPW